MAHRGADSRRPCASSRERHGGSGPDHSPERIIGDRIVDVSVAIQRQRSTIQSIQKQWRFHKYNSLIEW